MSGLPSGNRVLRGQSDLIGTVPIDIPLEGIPLWVVGASEGISPTWVVALDDGSLEAWRVEEGEPIQVPLDVATLPPGTPPVVLTTETGVAVLEPPPDASILTYPAVTDESLAYVTEDGRVVIQTSAERRELAVDALPDSRIAVSADGLLAVLAGATTRYPHGVLGDDLEASRVVIIDSESAEIVGEAIVPEPSVIEGISAIWGDADGDGDDEILVTISNSDVGAALAVFDDDGSLVAEGPPIGRSNRWRNQLGIGPTGPNGEIEIVDVRVPHIGGVVEYFRLDGSEITFITQQSGYTSHVYGSRNLDMALAADATGDGRIDVLIPNQDLTELGILTRVIDGVAVAGSLPLPGRLTTNLAGIAHDGGLSFAVGTSDQVLRVYPAS